MRLDPRVDPSEVLCELALGRLTVAGRWTRAGVRCLELALAPEDVARTRRLTPREREVLSLAGRGLAMKVIGYELGISAAAAACYLATARVKTGFESRQELIFWHARLADHEGVDTASKSNEGTIVLESFDPSAEATVARLSRAEREVTLLAARGLSNSDIAERRGVSTRTVANQLASVFKKLRIGSRFELVAKFPSC